MKTLKTHLAEMRGREAADVLKISQAQVSRLKNGLCRPSLDLLQRCAAHWGADFDVSGTLLEFAADASERVRVRSEVERALGDLSHKEQVALLQELLKTVGAAAEARDAA